MSCFLSLSLSSYQDPTTPVIYRPFRAVVSGLADTRGSIKNKSFFVWAGVGTAYTAPDLSAVFQFLSPTASNNYKKLYIPFHKNL